MKTLRQLCAWTIAIAVVALPIVAVLNGWVGHSHWPLTRLQIVGQLTHVSPSAVRLAVLPSAQRGFFAVDLAQAQHAVESLPWVKHAQVSKHWPNRLDVVLEEQRAYARWGDARLMSVDGQLFAVPQETVDLSLPLFKGADSNVADIADIYNQACRLFAPVHLTITQLEKNERGVWSLTLNNGILVVIGRDAVFARLRRFVLALPQLFAIQTHAVSVVDLRYPDGFALRFAPRLPQTNGGLARAAKVAFPPWMKAQTQCAACGLASYDRSSHSSQERSQL